MPKTLIAIGVFLIISGIVIHYAPWLFNWFGKLPGDINIEKNNTKIFIPITSMIIISIVLSLITYVLRR